MGEHQQEARGQGRFEPLAYWDNGAYVYTANVPLIMPDDFKGLRASRVARRCSTPWPASLAPFRKSLAAFGELYQALQTGVADGEDNVPSNASDAKLYEVQKYLTVSHHGRLTYSLITNKKFWRSLPPDVRAGLDRAVKESDAVLRRHGGAGQRHRAWTRSRPPARSQIHVADRHQKKAAWIAKLMPVHTR